ncbi:serine-rich adhesin for platelets-like [Maniola hyperantus]|uniref:serine-rich adhesin for platelets-like n=1 Tax=Aphantopus hyperantus TaxID=2795564 RepID=UPI0015694745|nr:uncharacterized protein LOC117996151 [Maniola hyperantus]XP_034840046.1 uncharacterized protein LOC117996151 [Maniola hyperantus]
MEVAGNWRREWAGSAEYGKVTEGGVTRNVARAMEVLHASAPGARVRVMRAAYHSSAGPGAPASSYLMHSSRQVLSSGYNFLEPTPLRSKPLEISSTPLESSPESEVERGSYKVTEPDDYDISEPSKWRGSTVKNSIRMPSEESSSADNASIIDLDSRTNSMFKRTFQTKQSDDKSRSHIINTRVSPLLDAPVSLSTLKYTSILNSTDEWNNRRKSYSFEDTSPLDQNALPQNNSYTIDSSTDSGICKSSEIVNDSLNCPIKMKNFISTARNLQDESFKQWLSRNRSNSYRDTSMTPPRSYRTSETPPSEGKITLQSSGKVSITLPFETQKSAKTEGSVFIDDSDRKTKKVEFCKTELHFAVDTGTVNIIATDEKPPPSNDFRRRRSAFVPLNNKVDRSITLFGEKPEFSEISTDQGISNNECGESDENTAATKSILKNKILKPKPYLLGENMVFGSSSVDTNSLDFNRSQTRTSAVSLINSQFQSERRYSNETISSGLSDIDSTSVSTSTYRTGSKGPQERFSNHENTSNKGPIEIIDTKPLNKKAGVLPEVSKAKVRELRGRDLAYFGIGKNESSNIQSHDNLQEEIFHSVKLVQQVSNSVCNSEAESDDAPEYQNLTAKYNFNKVPTPSPRTKFDKETKQLSELRILKPIREQDAEHTVLSGLRNNSLKRHKDPLKQLHQTPLVSSRTIKEKQYRQKDTKDSIRNNFTSSGKPGNNVSKSIKSNKENQTFDFTRDTTSRETETPLYVNVNFRRSERKENHGPVLEDSSLKEVRLRSSINKDLKTKYKQETARPKSTSPVKKEDNLNKPKENVCYENKDKKYSQQESHQHSPKKHTPRRTEKLITPDIIMPENISEQTSKDSKRVSTSSDSTHKKFQRNESLKRTKPQNSTKVILEDENVLKNKVDKHHKEKGSIKSTIKSVNNHSTITSNENKSPSKSSRNTIMLQKVDKTSDTKLDKSTKSQRNKYVINYNDKNGTVSSICKIKKGPGTYKRKVTTIENKIPEESNTKEKSLNKIALLQLRERYWNTFKQDSTNRKRKSNTHAQRSCQLL